MHCLQIWHRYRRFMRTMCYTVSRRLKPSHRNLRKCSNGIMRSCAGLPFLVAVHGGRWSGIATLRHTAHVVHIAIPGKLHLRAPGKAWPWDWQLLLSAALAKAEVLGFRQVIAVIGNSGNTGSIGLHHAAGFKPVGTLTAVGLKHGRWIDTVIMQRALGESHMTLPGHDG